MAINPNFVFTDAVPAQQAVSMAQIAAAEDAARRQMMSETLRSLSATQVARENSAQQRYLTQSQIAQQDKALAQREGESIRMADIYKQQVGAQTKQTVDRERENRAKIQSETIRNALAGGNLPSPGKWQKILGNTSLVLNDDEKLNLDSEYKALRSQAEKNYNMSAGIANAIQAKLDKLDPKDTATRDQEIANAEKRYKGLIMFNPETGRMQSVFPKPEMDEEPAPPALAVPPAAVVPSAPAVSPIAGGRGMFNFGGIGIGLNAIDNIKEIIGRLGGGGQPVVPPAPPPRLPPNIPFYPAPGY